MTETFRQDARNFSTTTLLALALGTFCFGIARADLPNLPATAETPPSLLECILRKGKSELCDLHHQHGTLAQSASNREKLNSQLNQLRIDSLRNDIRFDVPLASQPNWYINIGEHLGGTALDDRDYEIASDPIRVAETEKLRHPSPGVTQPGGWAKFAFELTPYLPFGYNPANVGGNHHIRTMVAQLVPAEAWNLYETRWHPLTRQYDPNSFADGLRDTFAEGGQDIKEGWNGLKTQFTTDPAELGREFYPGESIEVEHYGSLDGAIAPIIELFRFSKIPGIDFGGAVTAGFTTSTILHYSRCRIEVIDDTRMKVTFTRMVSFPGSTWRKIFGNSFGFVVGLGPFIDAGPVSEDWLLPKWEPISWTRYGVESDIFLVDRSAPGLPAETGKKPKPAVSVSQALREAYRWGKPANLFRIAIEGEHTGQNLGVTRVESGLRYSSETEKNAWDLVLWGHANPRFTVDLTRTTYPESSGADQATSPTRTRLITEEFQNGGHGPRHSKSLDVGLRTNVAPISSPPLSIDQQTQSLRMTFHFSGGHATRDEMIEFLITARALAQSAIAGKPRGETPGDPNPPSLQAVQAALPQIETALAQVRALPADAHAKVSEAYFYVDLDQTALMALLGPDRAAEYLDEWLKTYGEQITKPSDWERLSANERRVWVMKYANDNHDQALLDHLDAAWDVIEAAQDAQKSAPTDRLEQARLFINRLKDLKNLDLYPFAGMTQLSGNPTHLFLVTRLDFRPEKGEPLQNISFASVGSQYKVPITMMAAGKAE